MSLVLHSRVARRCGFFSMSPLAGGLPVGGGEGWANPLPPHHPPLPHPGRHSHHHHLLHRLIGATGGCRLRNTAETKPDVATAGDAQTSDEEPAE